MFPKILHLPTGFIQLCFRSNLLARAAKPAISMEKADSTSGFANYVFGNQFGGANAIAECVESGAQTATAIGGVAV